MAVNHADGTLFVSIVFYPIAAGKAAISAQAGWFTILFVAASIPVGFAVISAGRKLIYWMMDLALGRDSEKHSKWFQNIIGVPVFLAYFLLPLAITGAGIWGTWLGTIWLVKHVL